MPNELQFLRRENFRQMAPPILRLEADRMQRLMAEVPADLEARNALVRARFALNRLLRELREEEATPGAASASSEAHLRTVLMNLSLLDGRLAPEQAAVLRYIVDRIGYVHDRLPLLY